MATVRVKHNPNLTADVAIDVFKNHFGSKYEVYKTTMPLRDFMVRKNGFTGVSVKLQQKPDATMFAFTGFMPSPLVPFMNLILLGLPYFFYLRPRWKTLEGEVAAFVQSAPEFQ